MKICVECGTDTTKGMFIISGYKIPYRELCKACFDAYYAELESQLTD
jgi:hypothetical protein